MKVKKFSKQTVNFVFSDEKCTLYKINNLNCTEDEFMDWLETYDYEPLELKYGVHDYSGGEDEDGTIEVGFTSYEISKEDFPTVMEIWRKALLSAGFITDNHKVEIEVDEDCTEDNDEDGMMNDVDNDKPPFGNHYKHF
jgi:hypothetical protein